jgi:hypothetical protein
MRRSPSGCKTGETVERTAVDLLACLSREGAERRLRVDEGDALDGWLRYGKRVSADYSFNFVPSRSTFAVLLGPGGSHFLPCRSTHPARNHSTSL